MSGGSADGQDPPSTKLGGDTLPHGDSPVLLWHNPAAWPLSNLCVLKRLRKVNQQDETCICLKVGASPPLPQPKAAQTGLRNTAEAATPPLNWTRGELIGKGAFGQVRQSSDIMFGTQMWQTNVVLDLQHMILLPLPFRCILGLTMIPDS